MTLAKKHQEEKNRKNNSGCLIHPDILGLAQALNLGWRERCPSEADISVVLVVNATIWLENQY